MDEELFTIHLNVADRQYPLRIKRKDEGKMRAAAKMINGKVLQYKKAFSEGETRDFLAMAAVQLVVKLIELENDKNVDPIFEVLRDLDQELSEFINSEKTA